MISCADLLCSGKLAFVVVPATPAWGYYETSVHGLIYGGAGSAGMGYRSLICQAAPARRLGTGAGFDRFVPLGFPAIRYRSLIRQNCSPWILML